MTCPLNKKNCQGCEYSKGLCDYPYKVEMSLEQIKEVTSYANQLYKKGVETKV